MEFWPQGGGSANWSLLGLETFGRLWEGEGGMWADFVFHKPKSVFNTVRLSCGKTGICSDASSFAFEAQSLTNSVKAFRIVWKFAHGRSLG